jgi:hypothetical protein
MYTCRGVSLNPLVLVGEYDTAYCIGPGRLRLVLVVVVLSCLARLGKTTKRPFFHVAAQKCAGPPGITHAAGKTDDTLVVVWCRRRAGQGRQGRQGMAFEKSVGESRFSRRLVDCLCSSHQGTLSLGTLPVDGHARVREFGGSAIDAGAGAGVGTCKIGGPAWGLGSLCSRPDARHASASRMHWVMDGRRGVWRPTVMQCHASTGAKGLWEVMLRRPQAVEGTQGGVAAGTDHSGQARLQAVPSTFHPVPNVSRAPSAAWPCLTWPTRAFSIIPDQPLNQPIGRSPSDDPDAFCLVPPSKFHLSYSPEAAQGTDWRGTIGCKVLSSSTPEPVYTKQQEIAITL